MKMKFAIPTLCLFSVLFTGCFKDSVDEDENVLDIGKNNNICEIDTDALKEVLERDVTSEIDCLEDNLKQFTDFVKRDNKGIIKKEKLLQFIDKFFPGEAGLMENALTVAFDINTLLFRDLRDAISVPNLDLLFDFLRIMNKEGQTLNELLKRTVENDEYWEIREDLRNAIENLAIKIRELQFKREGADTTLEIMPFLTNLKKLLEIPDEDFDLELVESFLFAKKLLFGGNAKFAKSSEICMLLSPMNSHQGTCNPKLGFLDGPLPETKLTQLLIWGLDILYLNLKEFPGPQEESLYWLTKLRESRKFLFPWGDDELIATDKEIMDVAGDLLESMDDPTDPRQKKFNIHNIKIGIANIKTKLVGGSASRYTYGDLQTLLLWGEEIFEGFYFNNVTWTYFEKDLLRSEPIKYIDRPDLEDIPEWKVISPDRLFNHWKNFEYIVTHARQYPLDSKEEGDNLAMKLTYNNGWNRTRYGLNTLMVIRWGLTKVVNVYGLELRDSSGNIIDKVVDRAKLREFLLAHQDIMEEVEIWPNLPERFYDEAMNSSDLFQENSNGDGYINVTEASEYVLNILSSAKFGAEVFDYLAENYSNNDNCILRRGRRIVDDSITTACYRENFYDVIFEDMSLRKHFQKLYDYKSFNSPQDVKQYLKDVEGFARECPEEDVPMTKTEMARLFVSLSNIETTFIRFDRPHQDTNIPDNLLERKELDSGYPVFEKTIKDVAKAQNNGKPLGDGLAFSLYLYIVEKKAIPKPLALAAYHAKRWFADLGKKKYQVTAKRVNLGAVLAMISQAQQDGRNSDDPNVPSYPYDNCKTRRLPIVAR